MKKIMYTNFIDTPLGPMIAYADDHALYMLQFVSSKYNDYLLKGLQKTHTFCMDVTKVNHSLVLQNLLQQMDKYFKGTLRDFTIPLAFTGTPFQKKVWNYLSTVEYGTTCSYKQLANMSGMHKGFQAVAGANARNRFAIIIPCHRVINGDNKLGGYAGGLDKKEWLIIHEKNLISSV